MTLQVNSNGKQSESHLTKTACGCFSKEWHCPTQRHPHTKTMSPIKADAKPYHARTFPVPQAYKSVIKKDINRLTQIRVIKKSHNSKWAARRAYLHPAKENRQCTCTDRFLAVK
jgi:hypothetical protein